MSKRDLFTLGASTVVWLMLLADLRADDAVGFDDSPPPAMGRAVEKADPNEPPPPTFEPRRDEDGGCYYGPVEVRISKEKLAWAVDEWKRSPAILWARLLNDPNLIDPNLPPQKLMLKAADGACD